MAEVATSADITGGLVAGHDGSKASHEAVRWGARQAVVLGLPLHIVRTWTMTTAPRPASASMSYVPSMAEFEAAVREALESDVARLGLPADCQVHLHVVHGSAARRLLEAGANADQLVVGARGAGGFLGLLLGSTADQVVRHAPCPVTVVPAAQDPGTGTSG